MGRKAKLTPTTNDAMAGVTTNGSGEAHVLPKIVEAHEPTKSDLPPTIFPHFPLGNPVNIAAVQTAKAAEPQPLKIALIGTAPSSRMLAPFNDPTWKIWACSPGNMNVLPRVDAWFEVHNTLMEPEQVGYGAPYLEWLNKQTFPVYAQNQLLIPKAITIPMRELVDEFGPYFFTSSFSWMMAMAMKSGAQEIALYGIDMASREEYILQRPGAYHFFTEGKRRGIKMSAPYESDIMMPPPLYGYSDVTPFGRKIRSRITEIKSRLLGMKNQKAQIDHQIAYLEGALEDMDYIQSIFGGVQNNSQTQG